MIDIFRAGQIAEISRNHIKVFNKSSNIYEYHTVMRISIFTFGRHIAFIDCKLV
jgi:hypothetical protein